MGTVSKAIGGLLDMTKAARMKRAADQGFGPDDWYHGSPSKTQIEELEAGKDRGFISTGNVYGDGVYLTRDPVNASGYAEDGQVLKLRTGEGRVFEPKGEPISAQDAEALSRWSSTADEAARAKMGFRAGGSTAGHTFSDKQEALEFFKGKKANWEYFNGDQATKPKAIKVDDGYRVEWEDGNAPIDFSGKTDVEVADMLAAAGGGNVSDALKSAGYGGYAFNADSKVVFDNSSLRSVNAAFDPAKRTSANLLAGAAGTAGVGLLGMGSEEAEAGPVSKAVKLAAIDAFKTASPKGFDKLKRKHGKNNIDGLYGGIKAGHNKAAIANSPNPKASGGQYNRGDAAQKLESAGYTLSGDSFGQYNGAPSASQYYAHPETGTKVRLSDHAPVQVRSSANDIFIHPSSFDSDEALAKAISDGATAKPKSKVGYSGLGAAGTAGAGLLGTAAMPQDAYAGTPSAQSLFDMHGGRMEEAQAPQHPRLAQAAGLLGEIETPLDDLLGQGFLTEGAAGLLDKLSYGDERKYSDYVKMALDFF